MNLPNALTLLRLLLVPGLLIAVIYHWYGTALVVLAVAGLTDLLDGFLARRLNQKTRLGAFLDPLADKLLMTVSFIALAIQGLLPAWLTVLVVSRDFFLAVGAAILHLLGEQVQVRPTLLGKQTTFWQVLTLGLVLFAAVTERPDDLPAALFGIAAAMTVVSGLQYIGSGFRALPPTSPQ